MHLRSFMSERVMLEISWFKPSTLLMIILALLTLTEYQAAFLFDIAYSEFRDNRVRPRRWSSTRRGITTVTLETSVVARDIL